MSFPKSIKTYQIMGEFSYANSVLQAFIQLECFQEWIKEFQSNGSINLLYYNSSLTKDLYLLFMSLFSGNLDSSKLILDFNAKSQELWDKNINQDPLHFLFYFLDIIHCENNMPKNINFNMNSYNQSLIYNIHSDQESLKLFKFYLAETQNSFISNNFYNINKYMVNCSQCQCMFTYDFKKIFTFNLEELLVQHYQSNPLKMFSLNDCFRYSTNPRICRCQLCNSTSACEHIQSYQFANVLIIAFKRSSHNYNYKGDVRFYTQFDISEFLLNKNSTNKKYILKAVISCYGMNNYFTDVLINGTYFRIMDCKFGTDVKRININEMLRFEPMLLIYEIDNYQNNFQFTFMKMQNMGMMNNMQQMMVQNATFSRPIQEFQMINGNAMANNLFLKFKVIPENWDGTDNDSFPINPQVTFDSTLKYAIDKFYTKLAKPREAITKFTFNDIELDVNSQNKLKDMNINGNSIIYAIKSPNFAQINFQSN